MTIVKSILSSMPLYMLSFSKLPKKIENLLRSLQCNFLWGGTETSKRVAWVRWTELCKSKKEGGLGIKELGIFNQALLSKWVCRFLNEKESLWYRVIKSSFGDLIWTTSGERGHRSRGGRTDWWKTIVEGVEGAVVLGRSRTNLWWRQ